MSNIDKRALREAANAANAASWGYWESYKPHKGARGYEVKVGVKAVAQHCLKVDSVFIAAANPATVLALLDEVEALQSENERLAKALTERNGEPVEGLVKRVAELEEIATDYGMKFQRAQDALKHQSLLHKSQLEAAEKRIAEQREYYEGVIADGSKRIAELEIARDKCFLSGLKTGWAYGIADDTEGYNREISDAQAVIDRAAGIGKGE
ncbi:ead/Ea22-like family protein [Citrobacter sp. CK202]|uniref:ead/Ea22-like family protein n=1 Tax=Citrobacter sp. CK202 TaxID=2985111 RepID=UPI002574FE15|nr:ead/Ea22-like family protein [Citrobacter sp. CK202]MDM2960380.1 ead/Ea22-like family protein [Citrobacter sp. CK202]